ncbi:hypothetical protein BH20ACT5_BH20ACT5_07770 [soil metagenome]
MRIFGVVAMAAIPLQWFVLLASPAGDLRLHQIIIVAFTFGVALHYGGGRMWLATRRMQVFILANMFMFLIWAALNFFNGVGQSQTVEQIVHLAIFVAIGTHFFFAATSESPDFIDALRWTALVSAATLTLAFGVSMLVNGINPVSVLQQTIAAGDPNILQKELFKSSFAGFGFDEETVRGNLRHQVFGGLLFTMYASSWAVTRRPLSTQAHRFAYRTAMVVASLMLLVSLSRSVIIAAALWPVISFLRALLTGRVTGRQQLAVVFGVAGLVGLAVSGFLSVLWTRFTEETGSYTNRELVFGLSLERIADNFWVGGVNTVGPGQSSHNFVLDAWLRGGIFVGIPAIVVFLLICALWAVLLIKLPTLPPAMLPVVAAMALPCVRLVTIGGGLLQITEWATLGFVFGVVAALLHQRDRAQAPPPSMAAPSARPAAVADAVR